MQLVAVLVQDDDLLRPGLVDLAREDLADFVGIELEHIGLVDVHDAALEVLADVEDTAATEGGQGKLLGVDVPDLVVVVAGLLLDLLEGDLRIRVLDFFHDIEILVDFTVSLVDIDDDVEVVGGTVGLGDLGQEHVLEHTHHDRSVDVFLFLEILEGIDQRRFSFLFHCYAVVFDYSNTMCGETVLISSCGKRSSWQTVCFFLLPSTASFAV